MDEECVPVKRRRFEEAVELPCPFCGEPGTIAIDEGGGEHQTYVEDCAVCCRPRIVHLERSPDSEGFHVWLEREDGS
jgi:cysteine-rich CPXCG protein